MLLAEELLLLALDPEGGTPVNSSREPLRVSLCGALVAELGFAGLVEEQGRRLVPTVPPADAMPPAAASLPADAMPPADPMLPADRAPLADHPLLAAYPLLADVHRALGTGRGRRAADQLRRLDRAVGGVWGRVVDPLADAGVLGRRRDRVLVAHVTRHPVLRPAFRDEVVRRVRAAAASDDPLDPRTATLLALAGPSRLLEVVAPLRGERRHAKARIQDATEQTPVAPIVRKVIHEAQAASAAAVTAATVSASS
jgi:hypothetical protein